MSRPWASSRGAWPRCWGRGPEPGVRGLRAPPLFARPSPWCYQVDVSFNAAALRDNRRIPPNRCGFSLVVGVGSTLVAPSSPASPSCVGSVLRVGRRAWRPRSRSSIRCPPGCRNAKVAARSGGALPSPQRKRPGRWARASWKVARVSRALACWGERSSEIRATSSRPCPAYRRHRAYRRLPSPAARRRLPRW
jgi:hypothetical protein